MPDQSPVYDPNCRRCTRLAGFLDEAKIKHPSYFCRPVPPFGDLQARLVIVGLAPGMHGANRTGRPFTGDFAGILLYQTLYKFAFATAPVSASADDPLRLVDCRIANAVKCCPPQNKPLPEEVRNCNSYLQADLASLPPGGAILALGRIAFMATLNTLKLRASNYPFSHGARHELPGGQMLFASYHCSRYNTQTRRLSDAMFHQVFADIRNYLS